MLLTEVDERQPVQIGQYQAGLADRSHAERELEKHGTARWRSALVLRIHCGATSRNSKQVGCERYRATFVHEERSGNRKPKRGGGDIIVDRSIGGQPLMDRSGVYRVAVSMTQGDT